MTKPLSSSLVPFPHVHREPICYRRKGFKRQKVDPADVAIPGLPSDDAMILILKNLSERDWGWCCCISKKWRELISSLRVEHIKDLQLHVDILPSLKGGDS